ncbi:MAG TPA: tetracycline resistance MFS efflux pump [Gammaproteobacteria bacterium]|nr:tetracycline resistance MFS efflux pump [Gammaproteobacteria bacterium]|tara:strand:+ start:401 stop:1618 length:1218 start_codon:yes stop_codon:yes gene_type:complete
MHKRHALTFVSITVFLDTVGFGVIVPVLPQFLVLIGNVNLSDASALSGYLIFSYAVTNFMFAPMLGNLSDAYGRKPLLVTSLFVYGGAYLLSGFATALWMLFLGRLLTGITSATYAIANALIADVSTAEDKAQNFGLLGVAFGLGFIVGPALGGIIGAWDLRAPFFIASGLAFINTLYGLIFFRETLAPENRRPFELKRASPWGALTQLSKYPLLIGLVIAVFLNNIGYHIWPSNWNFYTIETFAWTPLDVGLSMAFVGVMSVIVQGGLLRIVIPKFGPVRCAYFGITATIVAFVGVATAGSSAALFFWCGMSSLGGLAAPSVNSILSNQVAADSQGELQGIMASVSSVAMIVGPLLLTQTFTYFTSDSAPLYLPGSAFWVAAILSSAALIIFFQQIRRLPNPAG